MCHLVFGPDKPPGRSGGLVFTCSQLATASVLDFKKQGERISLPLYHCLNIDWCITCTFKRRKRRWMACVSLLFSEVGEGGFREWEGVIIVYRGGGGVQCLGLHRCSLPCIHKIRKRIVLGLGLSTSVDP